jgi:hypothetical protein
VRGPRSGASVVARPAIGSSITTRPAATREVESSSGSLVVRTWRLPARTGLDAAARRLAQWNTGKVWNADGPMDVGVVMSRTVLAEKLEDGRARQRAVATWNTRRVPMRLSPGWTNRLFVACDGWWRGYFPLSGDVLWNPKDAAAPYALIFDPRR